MIRAHIPDYSKKSYYFRDTYFCTVDLEQKNEHKFKGENGQELVLFIASDKIKNHRLAHPNIGKIEFASEGSQFKVGDSLITTHFTFQDEKFNSKHLFEESGVNYYKSVNLDICAGVVDGKLVPREGVLLCSPVMGKLVGTDLEVLDKYEGKRRDIAIVDQIWEGCTEYKVGDYVLLNKGGDYYFDYNNKEYMKVDTYFDDVVATVYSPKWVILEERLHATHGEKLEI